MSYVDIGGPRAVRRVTHAVKTGKLVKPTVCADCGSTARLQGHHHNGYDEPHVLDVVWLCRPCHQVRHGRRARVPSWEGHSREYAAKTGRRVDLYASGGWHGFGDWSMPPHLFKTMRRLWAALRTDEEREAMVALVTELASRDREAAA